MSTTPLPALRTIDYRADGPICVITLNRPDDGNRMDASMLGELPTVWDHFRQDDELRVAVLTGAGEAAFCAGLDLAAIASRTGRHPARDEGERPYTSKQRKCWKPVIAAINGPAIGPGLHFVLDADICIAAPEASFFDGHLHWTGSVPIIEPIEMARRIPHESVSRLFLLGPHAALPAQRALELGLISEVVARDRLLDRALELARLVAQVDVRLATAFIESLYKARELGVSEAVNRGLLIRQLTGYRDAPLSTLSLQELVDLARR